MHIYIGTHICRCVYIYNNICMYNVSGVGKSLKRVVLFGEVPTIGLLHFGVGIWVRAPYLWRLSYGSSFDSQRWPLGFRGLCNPKP